MSSMKRSKKASKKKSNKAYQHSKKMERLQLAEDLRKGKRYK